MSKLDAVRAMREARYAEAQTRAGSATPAALRASKPKPATAAPAQEPTHGDRCGHRNISGRTCTRERGHAAKTHRYA